MTSPAHSLPTLPEVQLAAGGIVWRQIDGSFRLALIHRPKYDDWTLPKGKPDPGETLAETARREVREELGCDVTFGEFAGTTHYNRSDGKLKIVLFWHMVPVGEFHFIPNNEVDQVQWLTREEAAKKLDHPVEVELIDSCPPPKAVLGQCR
jgi:8-oxo-dGTP pyrophosphatase MutT (NUDIX family)